MKQIPLLLDFRIKDTAGKNEDVFYKALCCLRGYLQVAYIYFDPNNVYAPVVLHVTIRIFIVKSAAQGLSVESAFVDNAYLYGKIDRIIHMELPTNITGRNKHLGTRVN